MSRRGAATYICGDPTPVKDRTSDCSQRRFHTPAPIGYLEWHEWAEKKSRTHEQVQCFGCGLFAIWRPKSAAFRPAEGTEKR